MKEDRGTGRVDLVEDGGGQRDMRVDLVKDEGGQRDGEVGLGGG